jgi:hypothetical protein
VAGDQLCTVEARARYDPGMDIEALFLPILGWLVGTAITLGLLYVVIKSAVVAALREHTVNSTTAVLIRGSVPLTVVQAQEDQPQHEG